MLRSRQTARALKALAETQPCHQRTFTTTASAALQSSKRAGVVSARNQSTSAAKAPPAYVCPVRPPGHVSDSRHHQRANHAEQ